MSKLQFKGDLVHTEKYEKDGEQKKKYTKAGAVFQREDGSLTVKMFDTWFNVYPPKMKEEGYQAAKDAVRGKDQFEDEIPF